MTVSNGVDPEFPDLCLFYLDLVQVVQPDYIAICAACRYRLKRLMSIDLSPCIASRNAKHNSGHNWRLDIRTRTGQCPRSPRHTMHNPRGQDRYFNQRRSGADHLAQWRPDPGPIGSFLRYCQRSGAYPGTSDMVGIRAVSQLGRYNTATVKVAMHYTAFAMLNVS